MSREIKFRAWDGEYYWYEIMPSPIRSRTVDICAEITDYEPEYSNMVHIVNNVEAIEQYTGLEDKNGKEIYEGDIVKARWRRAKNARLDTEGEVRFADGWFYVYDDPDGQDRLGVPIHNCYDIEVIGNIHESNMEGLCPKE